MTITTSIHPYFGQVNQNWGVAVFLSTLKRGFIVSNLPYDVCRCSGPGADHCKVREKCARYNPPHRFLEPGAPLRGVPHTDFSFSGLPCQHFIPKERP